MKLVIVESPSKIKTIERYLSDEYKVLASYGHIVDLSTRGRKNLGINLETFEGDYVLDKSRQKVADTLKKLKMKVVKSTLPLTLIVKVKQLRCTSLNF